jgi:hypothetical protein
MQVGTGTVYSDRCQADFVMSSNRTFSFCSDTRSYLPEPPNLDTLAVVESKFCRRSTRANSPVLYLALHLGASAGNLADHGNFNAICITSVRPTSDSVPLARRHRRRRDQFRQPNVAKRTLDNPLEVPSMLSFLTIATRPLMMVLPVRNAAFSLTISNAKAGDYGLRVGLIWWIIGMLLASGYFFYVYRTFA